MIKSFRDAETEKVFCTAASPGVSPHDIQAVALRKMRCSPTRTTSPTCAVRRINDQWRICSVSEGGDAHEVEICDYHRKG